MFLKHIHSVVIFKRGLSMDLSRLEGKIPKMSRLLRPFFRDDKWSSAASWSESEYFV